MIARQMRSASIVTRRLTTGCMTVCATPAYLEKHGTPTRPERSARASVFEPALRVLGRRARVHRTGRRSARAAVERDRREQHGDAAPVRAARHGHRDSAELSDRATTRRAAGWCASWRLPFRRKSRSTSPYPSRRHLPAKVRTFIDHLVEHFSQTPNTPARRALDQGRR